MDNTKGCSEVKEMGRGTRERGQRPTFGENPGAFGGKACGQGWRMATLISEPVKAFRFGEEPDWSSPSPTNPCGVRPEGADVRW